VHEDAARRGDILSRVNIVKRMKIGGRWKLFSIPRNAKGKYDWDALQVPNFLTKSLMNRNELVHD
jgi:hypothetical protein